MNINNPFTFTKSNSFTKSNTHTYTIASTNTNTHTNCPYIEKQAQKGFEHYQCQKKHRFFLDGFHSANDSINSSRWGMPAGKNPLSVIRR